MSPVTPRIVNNDHADIRTLHPVKTESHQFDENWLQELLFADPGLLPISEIDPSFTKLVPLARELSVTAGAVDLVCATAEGQLCIIETKLWRNPEAHRSVLSQLLDYTKDLVRMDYDTFRGKVESVASPHGDARDLLKIMAQGVGTANFDGILFEQNIRRALATGDILLLVVGDRIRPEVAMLSEILGSAPNLEFSLALVEIAFYHLDPKERWPILAVPSVVAKSHEVTRAVVRIRYEQKQPEVDVAAEEEKPGASNHTNMATFLQSLPTGFDEVFQPFLERWSTSIFRLYWGKVGFSLRYTFNGKEKTIVDAYPYYISVFMEKWLPQWATPSEAYKTYRTKVDTIPEVRRLNNQGKRYVRYEVITLDDMQLLLQATDQFALALVAHSESKK